MSATTVLLIVGACTTGGEHAATTVGTSAADVAADAADDVATAPGDSDRTDGEAAIETSVAPTDATGADTTADALDVETTEHPPELTVHIVGVTAPFAHDDLLAGQTATKPAGGIRSLSLLASPDDPAPAVVFAYGEETVEASYADQADTVVGKVGVAAIPSGHYKLARLVQAYSRFEVAATLHEGLAANAGTLSCLAVMGDDTLVDGHVRDAGYYHATFAAPNQTPTSFEGTTFPIPALSTTAGAVGVVEDGQWVVYFPIDLVWDAGVTSDLTLTITVNMHESFRWTDLLIPGYLPQVFDLTALSYEPVIRFGGNAFEAKVQ